MTYFKGQFVAIRSIEEPYYIARCEEDIPKTNSSRRYKIKWLERTEVKTDGICFAYSYEDKIRSYNIICQVELLKIGRFNFCLANKVEEQILLLLKSKKILTKKRALQDKNREEVNSNTKVAKILWDIANLINMTNFCETLSIANGPAINITGVHKKILLEKVEQSDVALTALNSDQASDLAPHAEQNTQSDVAVTALNGDQAFNFAPDAEDNTHSLDVALTALNRYQTLDLAPDAEQNTQSDVALTALNSDQASDLAPDAEQNTQSDVALTALNSDQASDLAPHAEQNTQSDVAVTALNGDQAFNFAPDAEDNTHSLDVALTALNRYQTLDLAPDAEQNTQSDVALTALNSDQASDLAPDAEQNTQSDVALTALNSDQASDLAPHAEQNTQSDVAVTALNSDQEFNFAPDAEDNTHSLDVALTALNRYQTLDLAPDAEQNTQSDVALTALNSDHASDLAPDAEQNTQSDVAVTALNGDQAFNFAPDAEDNTHSLDVALTALNRYQTLDLAPDAEQNTQSDVALTALNSDQASDLAPDAEQNTQSDVAVTALNSDQEFNFAPDAEDNTHSLDVALTALNSDQASDLAPDAEQNTQSDVAVTALNGDQAFNFAPDAEDNTHSLDVALTALSRYQTLDLAPDAEYNTQSVFTLTVLNSCQTLNFVPDTEHNTESDVALTALNGDKAFVLTPDAEHNTQSSDAALTTLNSYQVFDLVPDDKEHNTQSDVAFSARKSYQTYDLVPATEQADTRIQLLDITSVMNLQQEEIDADNDFSPNNTSDISYVPETDPSSNESNIVQIVSPIGCSEEIQNLDKPSCSTNCGSSTCSKMVEKGVSHVQESSSDESHDEVKITRTLKLGEKRIYDKKHACYFCNKLVSKLARHLENVHSSELDVAELLAKVKNSKERKEGLLCILRAGDYFHNCNVLALKSGELILSRRPGIKETSVAVNKYGPCPNCLGFFLLSHLWHHTKFNCPKIRVKDLPENDNASYAAITRRDIRGESLALIGCNDLPPDFVKCILTSFKVDDISDLCKKDEILLKFGSLLFERYSSQQHDYIRQNLRQLSRLILQARQLNSNIISISDILQPQNFDVLIGAVKVLCESTTNQINYQKYGIPSLALKLGHNLRKCALILRGISLRKGDLVMDRKMEGFLSLMDIEWRSRVSSAALRTLREKQLNSTQLLPITADILKLNNYLDTIIDTLLQNFCIENIPRNWFNLASATLARIILFNKRRSGEASRITLQQYAVRPNWSEQCTEELKKSLTPLEVSLANRLIIVEVPGKSRKTFKVPILLTQSMKKAIDKLIETRHLANIDSKNIYIFARSNNSLSHLRGHDCLRHACKQIDLQKPELLTGTKLRKYIATVVQVFDLKETEYDWLARHLGHDIRIHREFYRLHESAVELTKVSRMLLAVDQGEANRFQGKTLSEIAITDLPQLDISDDSNNDEEDEDGKNTECSPINISPSIDNVRLTSNVKSDSISTGKQLTKGQRSVKTNRRPWSKEEKADVLNFFTTAIKKGIVPNKQKCEECKLKHEKTLQNRSWSDIKFCVYNQIKSVNRKNTKK